MLDARAELRAMSAGKKAFEARQTGDASTAIKHFLKAYEVMRKRFGLIFQASVYSYNLAETLMIFGRHEEAAQWLTTTWDICIENLSKPTLSPAVPMQAVATHALRVLTKYRDMELVAAGFTLMFDQADAGASSVAQTLVEPIREYAEGDIDLGGVLTSAFSSAVSPRADIDHEIAEAAQRMLSDFSDRRVL